MARILRLCAVGAMAVVVAAGCAPTSTPQATTADERLAAEYQAQCEKTWNESGKDGPLAYQGHDTYVSTCAEGRNPYTSTTRSAAAVVTTTTRAATTTSTLPCPPGTVTTHIARFATTDHYLFVDVAGTLTNTFPDPVIVRVHVQLSLPGLGSGVD
jgi:hypothetical protein